jgi:hypothetical protein
MQTPGPTDAARTDSQPAAETLPQELESQAERLLSQTTDEAMDGFEEWLKAFKEELADRRQ